MTSQNKIHVLLANLPPLLAEVIQLGINREADIKLVGVVNGNVETLLSAGWQIDFVIMGSKQVETLPEIGEHLLSHFPHLRIIAISNTGDKATLFWLRISNLYVNQLSAQALIRTIRQSYLSDSV